MVHCLNYKISINAYLFNFFNTKDQLLKLNLKTVYSQRVTVNMKGRMLENVAVVLTWNAP